MNMLSLSFLMSLVETFIRFFQGGNFCTINKSLQHEIAFGKLCNLLHQP
uniref:Uncharacterized protein n=1 Tax=Lepeophtheirus salmonis TaxID=72036 RepID=A0A0K2T1C1_LEPSM